MNVHEAKRERSGSGLVIALGVVVLLLPTLYVGAYFALLDPIGIVENNPPGDVAYHEEHYSATGISADFAQWFFCPIHQLDRWIRPKYWGK